MMMGPDDPHAPSKRQPALVDQYNRKHDVGSPSQLAAARTDEERQEAAADRWIRRGRGRSGPGSVFNSTVGVRTMLAHVFAKYAIRSMVDIPCGDWQWMRLVDLSGVDYVGMDVGRGLVDANTQLYGRQGVSFRYGNLVTTPPPRADLVLSREFLFHLPMALGARAVQNVRRSGARYLLTTTHPTVRANMPLRDIWRWIGQRENQTAWGYYDVNVELPPFDLRRHDVLEEAAETIGWNSYRRVLRMYKLR
jgi:hypothetical protein